MFAVTSQAKHFPGGWYNWGRYWRRYPSISHGLKFASCFKAKNSVRGIIIEMSWLTTATLITKRERKQGGNNLGLALIEHLRKFGKTYILLDGLVCSIVEYYYESRRLWVSPEKYSRTSTNNDDFLGRQSIHWLLFQPLYNGHFFFFSKVAVVERFNCIQTQGYKIELSKYLQQGCVTGGVTPLQVPVFARFRQRCCWLVRNESLWNWITLVYSVD